MWGIVLVLISGCSDPTAAHGPTEKDNPHLHNLLQVSDRIYSGGEPQDERAFAELAKMGVRTVVSVDGARPKLELAKQHDLRYVHIPIGYDGVPREAGQQFARLVNEVKGPIYIHCHHGKHRGPAGAAIACIADGAADNKSALTILDQAGTSKSYGGLWRDVRAYKPPAEVQDLPELVSVAEVDSLAVAMASIDRAIDNLKQCRRANWSAPADHPDITPKQEALLLKEGFRETVRRLEQVNIQRANIQRANIQRANPHDGRILTWMKEAEATAAQLESALRSNHTAATNLSFRRVQNQCVRCHGKYRDQ